MKIVRLLWLVTGVVLAALTSGCADTNDMGDYGELKEKADDSFYTGRYDEAKELYFQAEKLNNNDPELYHRLGDIALNRVHFQEAISYFQQAIKLDPQDPQNFFSLGSTFFLKGDYKQSIPPLEKAIELQPQLPIAVEYLGGAYYRVGRIEDAFKSYFLLAEIDPEHRFVYTYMGQIYMQQGNYEKSKEAFEKAIKINPDYAENSYWLGSVERQSGSYERAITLVEKAVQLNPNDGTYLITLGSAYFDQERYQEALDVINKAVEILPEHRVVKQLKELTEQMLAQESEPDDSISEGLWKDAQVVETKHFILKTNVSSEIKERLIVEIDGLFDQTAVLLNKLIGISHESSHRIKLNIFADSYEYRSYVSSINIYAKIMRDHGGYYSRRRNEIVFMMLSEDYIGELPHEFVHVHLARAFQDLLPVWLNEGLAEYVMMRILKEPYFAWHGYYWRKELGEALEEDSMLTIAQLISQETRKHDLVYPAAWALVTFLVDRFDENKEQNLEVYFSKLKKNVYDTRKGAFEEVFGKTDELDEDWWQFIREIIDDPSTRWRISGQ